MNLSPNIKLKFNWDKGPKGAIRNVLLIRTEPTYEDTLLAYIEAMDHPRLGRLWVLGKTAHKDLDRQIKMALLRVRLKE